jgi:hypothetical protein
LDLTWHDGNVVDESFIVVESKRKKKKDGKRKSPVTVVGHITRSQSATTTSALTPGRNGRKRMTPRKLKC